MAAQSLRHQHSQHTTHSTPRPTLHDRVCVLGGGGEGGADQQEQLLEVSMPIIVAAWQVVPDANVPQLRAAFLLYSAAGSPGVPEGSSSPGPKNTRFGENPSAGPTQSRQPCLNKRASTSSTAAAQKTAEACCFARHNGPRQALLRHSLRGLLLTRQLLLQVRHQLLPEGLQRLHTRVLHINHPHRQSGTLLLQVSGAVAD